MTKKLKPNRANQFRTAFAYTKGVDDAKRTIKRFVWTRFWWKGFAWGIMVGTLITCAVMWVTGW